MQIVTNENLSQYNTKLRNRYKQRNLINEPVAPNQDIILNDDLTNYDFIEFCYHYDVNDSLYYGTQKITRGEGEWGHNEHYNNVSLGAAIYEYAGGHHRIKLIGTGYSVGNDQRIIKINSQWCGYTNLVNSSGTTGTPTRDTQNSNKHSCTIDQIIGYKMIF